MSSTANYTTRDLTPVVVAALLALLPAPAWGDIAPLPPVDKPTPAADVEAATPAAEPELTARPIPTDLGQRLDEAILLLSLGNFEAFVESFAAPEVLAEMKARGAMAQVRADAEARPEKVQALHLLLRSARVQPILMNADGTLAVIRNDSQPALGEDTVAFQKAGGTWYLLAE